MGYILCIETATTNCSVGLGKDGRTIALQEDYSSSYSHAERLHLFIDQVLKENDLQVGDLEGIAVSKGPGSYTGLRIGVSAAKGLCFALDIPLISIATLEALALQVKVSAGTVIPLLDARRMEVYTCGFSASFEKLFDTRAQVLEENSFSEYLDQGEVHFIGNGVQKFMKICQHPNARFIEHKLPSASEMPSIAHQKFQEGLFEDVAYFEPYYLKDFIAG